MTAPVAGIPLTPPFPAPTEPGSLQRRRSVSRDPNAPLRPNGKSAVTSRTTFAQWNREHPARKRWIEDEARMRASFLGDRRHLSPFLVPHRFEGKTDPKELRRALLGYGVGLNKAYMTEIFGHVRGAPARFFFGPLEKDTTPVEPSTSSEDADTPTTDEPADGMALEIWRDATANGTSLRNFFDGKVLEWITTSPGGVIVCDTNKPADSPAISKADERVAGYRPTLRFVPFSAMLDCGYSDAGFRWMKLAEEHDEREPDDDTGRATPTRTVLYELLQDGTTQMARFDEHGKRIGPAVNMGSVVDALGRPRLPIIPARFREHPDLPQFIGAGLLMGLDDIVIDLFNTFSEMREAFRDASFSVLVHSGDGGTDVYEQFKDGSRLIRLGSSEKAKLERLAVDHGEVDAGMKLIEQGVKNWVLSAKRQAEQTHGAQRTAGIALVAEFQLDLKPLLVEVAEVLDEIEQETLFVVAQLAGASADAAKGITVERETSFRLEDEATRITRIVGEFILSLPLPPEVAVQLTLQWVAATGLIDMDAEPPKEATVDGAPAPAAPAPAAQTAPEDGTPASLQAPAPRTTAPTPAPGKPVLPTPKTMRDLIEQQARALAEAKQANATNAARMAPGAASALASTTSGGNPKDQYGLDLGGFPALTGS